MSFNRSSFSSLIFYLFSWMDGEWLLFPFFPPWFICHSKLHLVLDSVLFHWVYVFLFFFPKSLDFIFQRNFGGVRGTIRRVMKFWFSLFVLYWESVNFYYGFEKKTENSLPSFLVMHCYSLPAVWEICKQTQNEFGRKKLVHEALEAATLNI